MKTKITKQQKYLQVKPEEAKKEDEEEEMEMERCWESDIWPVN